jgi:AcrR family transcriptional regulator
MAVPDRRGSPVRHRRPGGRTARVNEAALTAVLDELVESGYASLTFERVAARAGVHRSTLYRRWANKEELVVEALSSQAGREVPTPDTGSLPGDLRELTGAIIATITSPLGEGLLRTLVSDAGRSADLASVGRTFWGRRFALAADIVHRAIQRGEIDDVDPQLFIEMLVAPLFLRLLVTSEAVTNEYADRVINRLLSF